MTIRISDLSKWSLFICIVICCSSNSTLFNRMALLVMFAFCGLNWVISRKGKLRLNMQFFGLASYGVMLFFSTFYAVSPQDKAQSVCFSYFVSLSIVFFLQDYIQDKKDINFYLQSIIVASVCQFFYLLSIYGLNIISALRRSAVYVRLGDESSNSNSVGLLLAYGAILAAFFAIQSKDRLHVTKLGYYLIMSILLLISLLSGSRKALFVLFTGLFIVFFFCGQNKNYKDKIKTIIATIAVIAFIIYLVSSIDVFTNVLIRAQKLIDGLNGTAALDFSSQERIRMIKEGWTVFKSNPILGEGVYASYHYFGTYSHNNFIEVLMNTGLLGFIIYYFPFLIYFIKFFRVDKNDKRFTLLLFFYCWFVFGGIGMVSYYEKIVMIMVIIISRWVDLSLVEKRKR